MPTMVLTASGHTYQAGQSSAEQVAITGAMDAMTDDDGRMIDRPECYKATVERTVPRQTGQLPLFAVGVASRRFNLLERAQDQHPKAKLVLDRLVGTKVVPLMHVELTDVQPTEWTLNWEGSGNDGLRGCTFVETVTLTASRGQIVDPATNAAVPFDLT